MKFLLVAVNAKYIHSNPAIRSLRAYSCMRKPEWERHIELAEYTINQPFDQILADICARRPDAVGFSCYIWNWAEVRELIVELAKILPKMDIWLGGPEVSYDPEEILNRYPSVTGIMAGEGEETFAELAEGMELVGLQGITWRREDREIIENPWRPVMDLNKVPFVYEDMADFEHKIIYYESSRGCPFRCSYCLSSIDKILRFRNVEKVKTELQFFINHKVPQVKFVDRTFNCSHQHAMEIWKYIAEHDNGITNFHFEVAADLLNEEEIALIQTMRPGLIQLEIGVQSTNPDTVKEIHRTMDFEKVSENVRAVQKNGNVHQHLDLIAGLPHENLKSFHRSFNDVYALRPEQLQLGFLKVLKGSYMQEHQAEYGLVVKNIPPYEVLYTDWLPYDDVLRLKGIEEMVEVYYNSGQFTQTMPELEKYFKDPFIMYADMAAYYDKNGYFKINHKRAARYEILLEFVKEYAPKQMDVVRELLTYDYYLRENAGNRPEFAGEYQMDKAEVRAFYEEEAESHKYLPGYEKYDRNQMRKMTHLERFLCLNKTVLFDYRERSPLTHEARTVIIAK